MKKTLITGANGLLGQKLVSLLKSRGSLKIIATDIGPNLNPDTTIPYHEMDITSIEMIHQVFKETSPDIVINTAAMTNVDQCEMNKEACWKLNTTAVSYLVKACEKKDTFLLHLSTDFIFDGSKGPYKEEDQPNPLNYYAESKLASEKTLEKSDIRFAIARTQLVYGIVPNLSRDNIILWVKKNLEEGKVIKVVNDQWRTPTLVEDLAKGCVSIAEKEAKGIFHISGKDMLTPYDMAVATASFFSLDTSLIEEVDGSIFTQEAKRPPRTGFILDKARKELEYEPVSFNKGLSILKSQLKNV